MLEENNSALVSRLTNSIHAGVTDLVAQERDDSNKPPKPDRKQRVIRNAGGRSEARPVRIGHAPVTTNLTRQSSENSESASSFRSVAEPGAAREMAGAEFREAANDEVSKVVVDLHTKFDAMRESFETLEAHVSIGLAKSIAEMIQREVAIVERQVVARHRYRTRYKIALGVVVILMAMIVADHFYPFFDRAAALVGY